MNPMNEYETFLFQIMYELITTHGYLLVSIKHKEQEIWLMNANNEHFPVIRLSASMEEDLVGNLSELRKIHRIILDMIQREGKLLILNTNPHSESMENAYLMQEIITKDGCENALFNETFPNLVNAALQKEPSKEMVNLAKTMEEAQLKTMHKQRKNLAIWDSYITPKLTILLCAVCVIYYLIANALSIYVEDPTIGAILSGAYYKLNVVGMHEYWRLFTAGFLHVDMFHLMFNLIALWTIGQQCENCFTKRQYLTVLIGAILMGNLFVFLAEGNQIALGISGGVFGLFGAYVVALYRSGKMRIPHIRSAIYRILGLNLMISLLPGISFLAHFGGFIWGCFLGILFVKEERWAQLKKSVLLSLALLVGVLCGMAVRVDVVEPLDRQLDLALIKTAQGLGWERYANWMSSAYLRFYTEEELGL